MSDAYKFQIKGASGGFDASVNGYSFTISVFLDGVAGINDIEQLYNALTDDNVPAVGADLFAQYGILDLQGCWQRNIEATPLGDRQFNMSINYQHSPFNTIRISSQTQTSQVESNRDRNVDIDNPKGTPVNVRYKYPADYGGDAATEREIELRGKFSKTQGGTYQKLVPESARTYELRETIDPDTMKDLVGTINDRAWLQVSDPPIGADTNKWMLTSVTGVTDNSQQIPQEWVNTYTFQYKVDKWEPEVIFVDTSTNEPVPDPVLEYDNDNTKPGSKAIVEAYKESDFGSLFPEFT